jgi:hypothetical protein
LPSIISFLSSIVRFTPALLGILLFHSISVQAQEITKAEILRFKIKSITTIDEDGSIKSIDQYNDKGDIKSISDKKDNGVNLREDFQYDEKGSLLSNKIYATEGTPFQVIKYTYDSIGRLLKSELYNWKNSLEVVKSYAYDRDGNKIREIKNSKTSGNTITLYKYENGLLIGEEVTNEAIGKEEVSTYKYNKKGLLVGKKSRYYLGNTIIWLTYSYNATGQLLRVKEKSNSGASSMTTFQYDSLGIRVSDRWQSSSDKSGLVTKYVIEY